VSGLAFWVFVEVISENGFGGGEIRFRLESGEILFRFESDRRILNPFELGGMGDGW
jgi:hypothetical protein